MPLTPKQERFVAEYLLDLNATRAAIRAGYAESSAHVTASRLLTNTKVRDAVASGQRAVQTRLHVTVEDIVARAWVIASENNPDRVSALALLARRHPEFSDKRNITVSERSETLLMVASMTPDELRKLAAGADADA